MQTMPGKHRTDSRFSLPFSNSASADTLLPDPLFPDSTHVNSIRFFIIVEDFLLDYIKSRRNFGNRYR